MLHGFVLNVANCLEIEQETLNTRSNAQTRNAEPNTKSTALRIDAGGFISGLRREFEEFTNHGVHPIAEKADTGRRPCSRR